MAIASKENIISLHILELRSQSIWANITQISDIKYQNNTKCNSNDYIYFK